MRQHSGSISQSSERARQTRYFEKKRDPGTVWGDLLVGSLPFMELLNINLGGRLSFAEVVMLVLFPIMILRRGRALSDDRGKWIFLFAFFWLIALVLSDVYNDSPASDYLRGWFKILVFIGCYAVLGLFLINTKRVLIWVTSFSLILSVRAYLNLTDDASFENIWKFGMGQGVALLICAPIFWRQWKFGVQKKYLTQISVIFMAIGFISFMLYARSYAGIACLTSFIVYFFSKYRGARINVGHVGWAIAASLLLGYAVLSIYVYAAPKGFLGEVIQGKFEERYGSDTTVASVVLGGRPEILVSTQAIADSPIIGYGSWARDAKYAELLFDLTQNYLGGVAAQREYDSDGFDLIPSHSHLTGAWVEAGILGGIFWIGVLVWSLLEVGPVALRAGDLLGLLVLIMLPVFLWNVLFSPFGAHAKIDAAFFLVIATLLIRKNKLIHS